MVSLDSEALDRIESALTASEEGEDRQRMAALSCCMEMIEPSSADLLRQMYVEGLGAETIAQRSRQSREAVYSILHRLRQRLFDCVQRRLTGEALP
jgi:RNA polymerase sigma-70 factor (ECF subfamily)